MIRTLRLSAALAGGLFLTGCLGLQGNGKPATETRDVDGFVAVESDTSLDIRVVRGDTFAVQVRVDANLLPHVRTRVRDGALLIDSDVDIDADVEGPHVVVTMPEVEGAALTGSGELVVTGFESDAPIRLALSGSGDVAFTGRAGAVSASLDGSGKIDLTGATGKVDLDLSGSGDIDARELHANEARVALSGSGNVSAHVTGRVDVELDGSGDIDLYGEPQLGRKDLSGSGEITVH